MTGGFGQKLPFSCAEFCMQVNRFILQVVDSYKEIFGALPAPCLRRDYLHCTFHFVSGPSGFQELDGLKNWWLRSAQ